jgi:hypothetical protein
MVYEIWDIESANLVASYDSEEDALAFVRHSLPRHEHEIRSTWALALEDDDGETEAIAAGEILIQRALRDTQRIAAG